ncbi:hypothetical protein MAE02_23160 [Microvirga aerophila]|uniref:Uncharacterized protein n=1 Tax=Microvirga aerophila TaxID=670291 RepID=A0A512BRK9_9HYPH|nr:hypothetical protein MAE02_23160 [Microvirga aerophila]
MNERRQPKPNRAKAQSNASAKFVATQSHECRGMAICKELRRKTVIPHDGDA